MSASEVIEKLEMLPPQERAEVLAHLKKTDEKPAVRCMDDATFDRAAAHVMERHTDLLRKLAE